MLLSVVAKVAALLACVARAPVPEPALEPAPEGLTHAELDLIRSYPGAEKIYVEVQLPNGEPGVFLVDTGAGVSAITQELADELSLEVIEAGGVIQGLGGESAWYRATVPWVDLGGVIVPEVDVAVGIPGMPQYTGFIKVDGILGNNVWGGHVLAVDYPADLLELGLPGSIEVPSTAVPMVFDGSHIHTQIRLTAQTADGAEIVRTLPLEVDTGARQILLSGSTGDGLESVATEGEEPIFGLGASEMMPVSAFYRQTRHITITQAELGGATVEDPGHATWINYDAQPVVGPTNMLGLVGHMLLKEHRVVFDYAGGAFSLTDSAHEARQVDGHATMLARDLERHGEDAERALLRARYKVALEDFDGALVELDDHLERAPDDTEAEVLRARLLRYQGDLAGYAESISTLDPGPLAEEGEIIAVVNGLILVGEPLAAVALAEKAAAELPDESAAQVALADARLGAGDPAGARVALADAARLEENPDAYLKRRARVALAEGDRYAALSHLRTRLGLYPSDGEALWFYAMLVSEEASDDETITFQRDVEQAMARLHAESQPLDFQLASLALVGADTGDLMQRGIERDCEQLEDESSINNCMAWYSAMSGNDDDQSLAWIESAVADEENRSDFLDTLAMVHLARGEFTEAADAALKAARITPDRFYHLWQAERIRTLADRAAPTE
ncbi:MAG: hypothetical protein GY913_25455 [Proteobacteria bacterium]|nr:hypothetical protein [Pseudomonadota bacterium]MCP4920261.1 hypothetical protein [Pseudomonadota bacterium]